MYNEPVWRAFVEAASRIRLIDVPDMPPMVDIARMIGGELKPAIEALPKDAYPDNRLREKDPKDLVRQADAYSRQLPDGNLHSRALLEIDSMLERQERRQNIMPGGCGSKNGAFLDNEVERLMRG